uniref:Uncharacterized protein n=1 Tax=Magnetospirillum gryphiswaldense TaxID=55518 RepID=A4U1U3_9PROT|nr:hypothetical protein MGR_1097 [Magnetospirillum gryphiswaldense MSR-1]
MWAWLYDNATQSKDGSQSTVLYADLAPPRPLSLLERIVGWMLGEWGPASRPEKPSA